MKKFLLSSIFLFSLAYGVIACTEGLPTDNWEEPVVPVDPAVTTLRGSFESKFVRYSKGQQHEAQMEKAKIVTLWKDTLWQNDRTHKQIVLWSGDKKYDDLTYEVSDLVSDANSISASNIRLRFPSYIKGDDQALDCGNYESRTTTLIADALSEVPVTTLTTQDPVKIWVTINTPADAVPGIYTGTIQVKSANEVKQKFNLELLVVDHQLPAVADWSFHLDLWQFPFQLTTLCRDNGENVVPFSDEYFAMMKPFYQLLADAGQKVIDALSEVPVTTLTTQDPVKIWVTINTPADAVPGIYTGTIQVKSANEVKQKFNLELLVVDHQLPAVADWSFHLDLWQFPFQLTTLCRDNGENVVPFSDEYFAMMKPFYQLLADAGQKVITTYIKDGAFNSGQTMVKWSKNSSDEWIFDYTDFDKYVGKMMEWGINKQISCFSLAGWKTSVGYKDASGTDRTLELTIGTEEYNTVWAAFLTSFKTHLQEKGWFDKTVLYMDEIKEDGMKSIIALIKENDANWKIGLSGGNVDSGIENSLYDYSTILGYERQSDNAVSTFYTSCSQQYPNNYVTAQTNPAEMSWMAWYALAKGFDGYLRWAYDYWTQSDPTSAQDGSNASGDFNMIYRSENTAAAVPISSIRLELLREGIQDYEKARILNNGQLDAAIRNFTSASGREAAKWVGIAEGTLKELSAND